MFTGLKGVYWSKVSGLLPAVSSAHRAVAILEDGLALRVRLAGREERRALRVRVRRQELARHLQVQGVLRKNVGSANFQQSVDMQCA